MTYKLHRHGVGHTNYTRTVCQRQRGALARIALADGAADHRAHNPVHMVASCAIYAGRRRPSDVGGKIRCCGPRRDTILIGVAREILGRHPEEVNEP